SQSASVPAATTVPADDPDSTAGGSSNPASSATPLSGSSAPNTAGGVFGVPDSTVTTSAAMHSAGSCRNIGLSPFADSAAGGINEFFLDSDEDEQIDKLPDDAILDPRVKVETVSEYASSPPRNHRKHFGVRSEQCLWDKPVEDFFSSESESDDDMENYIPPLPYGEFKDWEMMNRYFRLNPDVNIGLDLWRDVNMLCQSLHSDDVEEFWRTQDEWVISSWKLYPKSYVHVLDLTNGKTVYMFVDKFYPIQAPLLERMLRHRLTVPPSYYRDVVVAGSVIQMIQDGLRESYECLASAPIQERVWLTSANGFGVFLKSVDSYKGLLNILWPSLTRLEAAVHRVHAVSFDTVVLDGASTVSAACIFAAGICFCCHSILLLREDLSRNLELTKSKPSLGEDC
ncbi:hypothetical protein Tco_1470228, partial [Tanacetum coccineum]